MYLRKHRKLGAASRCQHLPPAVAEAEAEAGTESGTESGTEAEAARQVALAVLNGNRQV